MLTVTTTKTVAEPIRGDLGLRKDERLGG